MGIGVCVDVVVGDGVGVEVGVMVAVLVAVGVDVWVAKIPGARFDMLEVSFEQPGIKIMITRDTSSTICLSRRRYLREQYNIRITDMIVYLIKFNYKVNKLVAKYS